MDREGELGWAPASHLQPTVNGPEITTTESAKGELNCINNEEQSGSHLSDKK